MRTLRQSRRRPATRLSRSRSVKMPASLPSSPATSTQPMCLSCRHSTACWMVASSLMVTAGPCTSELTGSLSIALRILSPPPDSASKPIGCASAMTASRAFPARVRGRMVPPRSGRRHPHPPRLRLSSESEQTAPDEEHGARIADARAEADRSRLHLRRERDVHVAYLGVDAARELLALDAGHQLEVVVFFQAAEVE